MIVDPVERARLAKLLGGIVDRLSAKHAARKTQEPAITAKIGQALEERFARDVIEAANAEPDGPPPRSEIHVGIAVQDMPDRGKGSLEKVSGVDLYVNVTVRQGGRELSKGLLVQAKKGTRRDDLADQCGKMRDRSDAGYAWIYGQDGCRVIDAADVLRAPDTALRKLPSRSPTDVFDAILECREGDPDLGLRPGGDEAAGLNRILRQLEAPRALSFEIEPPADVRLSDRPTPPRRD